VLGFLYCNHTDVVTKREDLWGMVNPDMNLRITRESLREVLYAMFYFSIIVHLEIEEKKPTVQQNKALISYLESAGRDINAIIDEKIMDVLPFDDLSESEVMTAVHLDYLNPIGIRRRCLKMPINPHKEHIGQKI
jgi:hypothetical protein